MTAAAGEHGAAPARPAATEATPAAAASTDSGDGDGLSIVALVVAGLGLLAGIVSLVFARRTRSREQEREGAVV